jgi:DNA-binding transcriptional regulator YiaG
MTDTMVPLSNERDMTPAEFRAWFDRLGLPEADLARRLDVTQPTINRWRSGPPQGRKPPGYLWRALEHLEAELEAERRPAHGEAPG